MVLDETGQYAGIVTAAEAALFPSRIFADLVGRRQPAPMSEDAPLDAVLQRLEAEKLERLPVCDEAGRVRGVVSRSSVMDALFAYEHRIANLDLVTGLPNRNALHARLEQLTSQTMPASARFAVVFIDLDNFKQVNDAFGHSVGDEMLRSVAGRLDAARQPDDFVCRFGGDEFVALLVGYPEDDALAARVDQLFAALNGHVRAAGREIFVTGSVGVTRFPEDGQDAESLLRQADLAMYRSKEAGREQVRYFDRIEGQDVGTRLTIANSLRKAYDTGEFWLAFQPQVNIATGAFVGAEVLMRCTSRELGPIDPGTFIPIAEESGLIATLSDWALRQLAEEIPQQLAGRLPKGFRLGVNLSASQLNPTTQAAVLAAAKALGACGYRLEAELTESTLTREPVQALQLLATLTKHEVSIAIDDFGTGFSNLSRLWEMPVDRLKISHDFTEAMTSRDSRGFALVRAIIAFARALDLGVTAEGVEREEQVSLLRDLGCDEAQGFWYARPVPLPEFLDRIAPRLGATGR
ncbi:putative bifunctional diguanylate cyclase/phosphodiesterase [Acidisoma sp. 7E03]